MAQLSVVLRETPEKIAVRVLAILTIDGTKETRIEGDSPFMAGEPGDELEQKGLGVWLNDWCDSLTKGRRGHHRSRVFVPWSSCLYIETKEVNRLERKIL
jgi:hypothetical protein